jgi:hypothetical protein
MCPRDALVSGCALVAFADCEDEGLAPLLDPAARPEFAPNIGRLPKISPCSIGFSRPRIHADVAVLTAAPLRRMRRTSTAMAA